MRRIKGLIVKDFLQIKDFKISLLFWTVIFVVLSLVFDLTNILAILTAYGFGMMLTFSFTFDEMSNSERYMVTLPFTRNEIVLSKYIFAFITSAIGAVVGDILNVIIQLITTGTVHDLVRTLSIAVLGMLVLAITNAIQIPCIMKKGAEASRMLTFSVGGGILLICIAIYKLGNKLGVVLPMDLLESIYNRFWLLIYIVLIALFYFVSYRISCKAYQNKDI